MTHRVFKFRSAIIVFLFTFLLTANALANEITPYADEVFSSITITLASTKKTTFECVTKDFCDSIKVTSCSLYQYVDGKWKYIKSLPKPDGESKDDFFYSSTVDYSDYIGTGTYKITATFNADGHPATRSSNERSF